MKKCFPAIAVCCILSLFSVCYVGSASAEGLPEHFVYIEEIIPDAQVDLRYFTDKNFLGRRVAGFEASRCIITGQAAEALKKVQEELKTFGLGLKIFDAYRPQRAVDDFVKWCNDLQDTRTKAAYYPRLEKKDLMPEGYISPRSGHSRGATVDLTIGYADGETFRELDMGTAFDFFGPEAWSDSPVVPATQRAHRLLLKIIMEKHGFIQYPKEWWHFTLKNEPFPSTYFDFPIK